MGPMVSHGAELNHPILGRNCVHSRICGHDISYSSCYVRSSAKTNQYQLPNLGEDLPTMQQLVFFNNYDDDDDGYKEEQDEEEFGWVHNPAKLHSEKVMLGSPHASQLQTQSSRSRPINKPNLNPSDHPEYYSADGDGKELLIGGESLLSDGKGKAVVQVPRGYLAVYVGPELQRYVIPACYLSMPEFMELMEKAAEEFGYQHDGGLSIPNCEEDDFEVILTRCLAMQQPTHKKNPSKTIQL
ncbi:hypothetical protein ACSBR2_043222 [Camellia fascicularis]